MADRRRGGRGAAAAAPAAGGLDLIHTTNSPNPVTARVPGPLSLCFRAPCGTWRMVQADAWFVIPVNQGYSLDRRAAYATKTP